MPPTDGVSFKTTLPGDTPVDSSNPLPVTGTTTVGSALPAGDNNIGNVDLASAIPTGTNSIGKVGLDLTASTTFTVVATGEIAGSATDAVMPTVTCKMVKFKASYDNAGRVYIGITGVTKADGSTDATTGYQLGAGEETPWLFVANLNVFHRICDNAGDDLTYIAMVS